MYIVADFEKLTSIEQYKTLITSQLRDLDIGILVANAGNMEPGPY